MILKTIKNRRERKWRKKKRKAEESKTENHSIVFCCSESQNKRNSIREHGIASRVAISTIQEQSIVSISSMQHESISSPSSNQDFTPSSFETISRISSSSSCSFSCLTSSSFAFSSSSPSSSASSSFLCSSSSSSSSRSMNSLRSQKIMVLAGLRSCSFFLIPSTLDRFHCCGLFLQRNRAQRVKLKDEVNGLRSFLHAPDQASVYHLLSQTVNTLREQEKALALLQRRMLQLQTPVDDTEIHDAASSLVQLSESDHLSTVPSLSLSFPSFSRSSSLSLSSASFSSSSSPSLSFPVTASSPFSFSNVSSSSSSLVSSVSMSSPSGFDFEAFERVRQDSDALQKWMTDLLQQHPSLCNWVRPSLPHDFPFIFSSSSSPALTVLPITFSSVSQQPSAGFLHCDSRFAELLGISPEEAFSFSRRIHPEWMTITTLFTRFLSQHPGRVLSFVGRSTFHETFHAYASQSFFDPDRSGIISIIRRASPEEAVFFRDVTFRQLEISLQ